MISMGSGFASYRGKGGGRGGSRGGGSRGGSRGRGPARSIGRRHHSGKGVYGSTRTGRVGRVGGPGSYNYKASYNSRGGLTSVSRAYGMARSSGFGQPGTGRGSFRISAKNFNRSMGRGTGGGGGVSSFRSVASGTGGGGSAGGSGPGGGSGGGTNTPGAAAGGPFRVPRERESRARARAEIRGSRALATRRALRIGSSGSSAVNTGRRRGGRTGVQV